MADGSPQVILRPAGAGDARCLWRWRNAPDVREVSFHSAPISWPDHCRWYRRALKRADVSLYIAVEAGESPKATRIGTLRLDRQGVLGYVSIILDPAARGRGLAVPLLRLLEPKAVGLLALVALIKPPNPRSYGAFVSAGYGRAYHDERLTMLVKGITQEPS